MESYAKKGFTNKEIALALGLVSEKSSEKKNELSEQRLQHARAGVTSVVRTKFLALGFGGDTGRGL